MERSSSADQGTPDPTSRGRRSGRRPDPEQSEGPHRLGLPLQHQRPDILDLDAVTDEGEGGLAKQHLPRGGRRLQPSRDVRCVPRHERHSARAVTGQHLAGVDSEPDRQLDPEPGREVLVQISYGGEQVCCSAHRPQGVVFAHGRDAEDPDHGVPDELLNRATMLLHGSSRTIPVVREDASQNLRIDGGAEHRRVDQVTEEDRHRLALAHRRRRQRRGTPGAEGQPGRRQVLLATRARPHAREHRGAVPT